MQKYDCGCKYNYDELGRYYRLCDKHSRLLDKDNTVLHCNVPDEEMGLRLKREIEYQIDIIKTNLDNGKEWIRLAENAATKLYNLYNRKES